MGRASSSHQSNYRQAAQAALVKLRHARDRTATTARSRNSRGRSSRRRSWGDAHDAATVDGVEVVTWTYVEVDAPGPRKRSGQAPIWWAVLLLRRHRRDRLRGEGRLMALDMTVAAPSGVTFKDELVAMLAHHSADQPRSQQRRLGPSGSRSIPALANSPTG